MVKNSEQRCDELLQKLQQRFGEVIELSEDAKTMILPICQQLTGMAGRGSVRAFRSDPLPDGLMRLLLATALSAPTKSDLQQADIVVIEDKEQRSAIGALVPSMPWIGDAGAFLVFCGNNRRHRQMIAKRGQPFVNDHLDAFFNASVDAAIVLATFVIAAEAVGLGCCPISVIRNSSSKLSDLLNLPDHVFPVAGLAVGWPAREPRLTPRLGLDVTIHQDRYDEDYSAISAYDQRRNEVASFPRQRLVERFGESTDYGWSEDKARQYAEIQRADFGAFIRAKGFCLD